METPEVRCEHRWIHFVDVESRAIRERKCERCGQREPMGRMRKEAAAAGVERKSA